MEQFGLPGTCHPFKARLFLFLVKLLRHPADARSRLQGPRGRAVGNGRHDLGIFKQEMDRELQDPTALGRGIHRLGSSRILRSDRSKQYDPWIPHLWWSKGVNRQWILSKGRCNK